MNISGVRRASLLAAVVAMALVLVPAVDAKGPKKPKGASGTITALSYNVAGLPEPLSGSEPATNSVLISPLLNAYELVLLQEDWVDALDDLRGSGLVDDVPETGYHHDIVSAADHAYQSEPAPPPYGTELGRLPHGPTLSADGLNRLSRYAFGPIHREMWRSCFGDLTFTAAEEVAKATGLDDVFDDAGLGQLNHEIDGGSADCGAQKGFSMARTELAPGVEVDVYNLHADAGGDDRDVAARADNFAQLTEFINDVSQGRAVILGGDTNLKTAADGRPGDADTWARFRESTGLTDVCTALDCGADDHVIDKFAYRSASGVTLAPVSHHFERERFTRADGEALSDHDALAVTFEWQTGKVKPPEKDTKDKKDKKEKKDKKPKS